MSQPDSHLSATLPDFIGDEVYTDYATAQVVILPVPYEVTTTYRKGCQHGPAQLLDASYQLEYYDDELRCEPCFDLGIFTHPAIADTRLNPALTPMEMLQETKNTIQKLLTDQKFVITLGGEHAITAGVVQGYLDVYQEPFTVVQIDAHTDLRQTFEGSPHNHACVMRRLLELGLPSLPVAIRCLCREEVELIQTKNIPVTWAWDIQQNPDWITTAIANIKTDKVFLTLDLDGLDPSIMPAVGTPEPGGLTWYETLKFLRQLFTAKQVIGCDVMELAPIPGNVVSEYTAAKLVYKLIGYWHHQQEKHG